MHWKLIISVMWWHFSWTKYLIVWRGLSWVGFLSLYWLSLYATVSSDYLASPCGAIDLVAMFIGLCHSSHHLWMLMDGGASNIGLKSIIQNGGWLAYCFHFKHVIMRENLLGYCSAICPDLLVRLMAVCFQSWV